MTATTSIETPRRKDMGAARSLSFGQNPAIVPVCPPVVEKTYTRRLNVANYNGAQTFVQHVGGTLSSVSASFSLSSYTVKINGTPISIGDSIAAGDLVEVAALPRQASGTVDIVLTLDADSVKIDPPSYHPLTWSTLRNGTQFLSPLTIGGTSNESQLVPMIRTSGNTFAYSSDAVATERFTGAGSIIMRGNDSGVEWGCGLLTTGTPTWPGLNLNAFRHGLYVTASTDRVFAYESGANPAFVNFASLSRGVSPQFVWFRITDTGSAVIYYYSLDAGATWTAWYTSAQPYVASRDWWVGVAGARLSPSVIGGVFLSSPTIQ